MNVIYFVRSAVGFSLHFSRFFAATAVRKVTAWLNPRSSDVLVPRVLVLDFRQCRLELGSRSVHMRNDVIVVLVSTGVGLGAGSIFTGVGDNVEQERWVLNDHVISKTATRETTALRSFQPLRSLIVNFPDLV